MPFNIGDVVKFKNQLDYEHVTRGGFNKNKFPSIESYAIISYSRKSREGTWYVRLEGCDSEEFFARRFELVEKDKDFNPKYALVINKIKQMELKRKANGYTF